MKKSERVRASVSIQVALLYLYLCTSSSTRKHIVQRVRCARNSSKREGGRSRPRGRKRTMGCRASKDVMDAEFHVQLEPEAACEYLKDPNNWPGIIPGCQSAVPVILTDVWELHSTSGSSLMYEFTGTRSTAATLRYRVRVTGTTSGCVPIDFAFQVQYTFTNAAGRGTKVRRRVDDLHVFKCACMLGSFTRSSLIKGLEKENASMSRLMVASDQAV